MLKSSNLTVCGFNKFKLRFHWLFLSSSLVTIVWISGVQLKHLTSDHTVVRSKKWCHHRVTQKTSDQTTVGPKDLSSNRSATIRP